MKHLILLFLSISLSAAAQTADWKLMHRGNRAFEAKQYDKAEQLYLQAIKQNPNNTRAHFNLGDTYLAKKDGKAAIKQFQAVAQAEKNKQLKAMAYHNMGVINQAAALEANGAQKQQYLQEAIEHYKASLRNNSQSDRTRYNLALCQHQLKRDKNQQQQRPQQQPRQQQDKQQDKQQQQSPQQQKNNASQSEQEVQQLLNLARQAEQQARQKVNKSQAQPRKLEKNW